MLELHVHFQSRLNSLIDILPILTPAIGIIAAAVGAEQPPVIHGFVSFADKAVTGNRTPPIGFQIVCLGFKISPFKLASPDGIQMNVSGKREQILIAVNRQGFEAALKNMPALPVAAVETDRVCNRKKAHEFAQSGLRGLNEKVKMVDHQYKGDTFNAVHITAFSQPVFI